MFIMFIVFHLLTVLFLMTQISNQIDAAACRRFIYSSVVSFSLFDILTNTKISIVSVWLCCKSYLKLKFLLQCINGMEVVEINRVDQREEHCLPVLFCFSSDFKKMLFPVLITLIRSYSFFDFGLQNTASVWGNFLILAIKKSSLKIAWIWPCFLAYKLVHLEHLIVSLDHVFNFCCLIYYILLLPYNLQNSFLLKACVKCITFEQYPPSCHFGAVGN